VGVIGRDEAKDGARPRGGELMDLAVWLPSLFVLGWVSLAACLAFTEGCARI
jgi:hypothetical protein